MRMIFKMDGAERITKCVAYRDAVMPEPALLSLCDFPAPGTAVDLAVSGGPDSVAMTLLAVAAGLQVTIHHVDHHLRPDSSRDAACVQRLASSLNVPVVIHDVTVDAHRGVEAGARAARRAVMPRGALTGHTMDDLAETVLINLVRGAGREGLSPMVGDVTKPLLRVRRAALRAFVDSTGHEYVIDPTNADPSFLRNDIRLRVIPNLSDVAHRDVVPVLARQAYVMAEESTWLDELTEGDRQISLHEADCRELREWHPVRLRRWLRLVLVRDDLDGTHPPSLAEVERVASVVRGDVTATEIGGGRRVSRHDQHLSITSIPPATL